MATETIELGLSWDELRIRAQEIAFAKGEYAGLPLPLHDQRVSMAERHPRAKELEGATLGPSEHARPREFMCSDEQVSDYKVRNEFWSKRLRSTVWVFEDANEPGRIQFVHERFNVQLEPLRRWSMLVDTIDVASQAWSAETELRAMDTLRGHINGAQFAQYVTLGTFVESSKRSQAHYLFRRARPTIVMLPRSSGDLRPTVALCHHPLAYYDGTFAGGMVPTDDVIAALLLMRADEAGYWRRSNQHPLDRLQAGL